MPMHIHLFKLISINKSIEEFKNECIIWLPNSAYQKERNVTRIDFPKTSNVMKTLLGQKRG